MEQRDVEQGETRRKYPIMSTTEDTTSKAEKTDEDKDKSSQVCIH